MVGDESGKGLSGCLEGPESKPGALGVLEVCFSFWASAESSCAVSVQCRGVFRG